MTLTQGRATSISTWPEVFECSFSGYISFAITSAAGADITLAASRCLAGTPMPT